MTNIHNALTFLALFIFIFSFSCVCNRLFNFFCNKRDQAINTNNTRITIEDDEIPPKYEDIDTSTNENENENMSLISHHD